MAHWANRKRQAGGLERGDVVVRRSLGFLVMDHQTWLNEASKPPTEFVRT
jgi:hypothetical protein